MESRLQEYNKELRHVASTDPLTKVWNRFRMLEHVEKCLKKYNRGGMEFMSLAIGDIDFFKSVNDTYGHECGDEVLRQMAHLFDMETHGIGAVARWGGEEFLLVFEDTDLDAAREQLDELMDKIRELDILYDDQHVHLTMTFGLICEPEEDIHTLLKEADAKLYIGKTNGRNQVVS